MIVIHAGMPKAGSSSIQEWLGSHSATLREGGFTVIAAQPSNSDEVVFHAHEEGPVDCGWITARLAGKPEEVQAKAVQAFVDALATATERYGNVVLSGESLAHPFWLRHSPTLAAFQWLSERYEVRVAYYARPQHTSIEAAWRQWGYRSVEPPSVFVQEYSVCLHYASTREGVLESAPDLGFEIRPFRDDLLDSGDVVSDFARQFLDVEAHGTARVNRSLPLEVASVLRVAPPGMFWDGVHDNERLARIKQLVPENALPEDERIALSRQVLRKYALGRFGLENSKLGWDDFVPSPDDADGTPGVDALDQLWAPKASPAELAILFRGLQAAIER